MTRTSTAIALYKDEKKLFISACALLAAMMSLYVYFVIAAVVEVVIRKEVASEAGALSSHVAELEAEYIAAEHRVSEEMATQEGYAPVSEKIYVIEANATLVLGSSDPTRYR